jgi:hypothetical protein
MLGGEYTSSRSYVRMLQNNNRSRLKRNVNDFMQYNYKGKCTINSMEYNLSREGDISSAGEKIPRLLWDPKVHNSLQNSSTLDHIPSQANPVHTFTHYFS